MVSFAVEVVAREDVLARERDEVPHGFQGGDRRAATRLLGAVDAVRNRRVRKNLRQRQFYIRARGP